MPRLRNGRHDEEEISVLVYSILSQTIPVSISANKKGEKGGLLDPK